MISHLAMSTPPEQTQLTSSTDSTDGVAEQVIGTLLSAEQLVQADSRNKTVGGLVILACAVVVSTALCVLELYGVLTGTAAID